MEPGVCPISNAVSYTSAPTSPGRTTTINAYFFSVPTTPSRSRSLSRAPSRFEPDPRTPTPDDFRFGSLEFLQGFEDGYDQNSLVMAYADELFCDGKMLPLKLPPRLQNDQRLISSTASSPGSRSLRLKMPFRRRALWNDEFDPFVAALEKVKENSHHHHQHCPSRRSRSLSPLKWGWGLQRSKSVGPDGPPHSRGVHGQSPIEAMLDNIGRTKGGEKVEARRQRIKRFLMKSASFGWKMNRWEKEESKTALLWKPNDSRRTMEVPAARRGNAVVRISKGIRSLVKHRPRLFCRTPKMN